MVLWMWCAACQRYHVLYSFAFLFVIGLYCFWLFLFFYSFTRHLRSFRPFGFSKWIWSQWKEKKNNSAAPRLISQIKRRKRGHLIRLNLYLSLWGLKQLENYQMALALTADQPCIVIAVSSDGICCIAFLSSSQSAIALRLDSIKKNHQPHQLMENSPIFSFYLPYAHCTRSVVQHFNQMHKRFWL